MQQEIVVDDDRERGAKESRLRTRSPSPGRDSLITNLTKVAGPGRRPAVRARVLDKTMGFQLVRDESNGDEGWIEVKLTEQNLLLLLSPDEP